MSDFLKSLIALLTGSYGWLLALFAWSVMLTYAFFGFLLIRVVLLFWG